MLLKGLSKWSFLREEVYEKEKYMSVITACGYHFGSILVSCLLQPENRIRTEF